MFHHSKHSVTCHDLKDSTMCHDFKDSPMCYDSKGFDPIVQSRSSRPGKILRLSIPMRFLDCLGSRDEYDRQAFDCAKIRTLVT